MEGEAILWHHYVVDEPAVGCGAVLERQPTNYRWLAAHEKGDEVR